jgi:hypothetical protein
MGEARYDDTKFYCPRRASLPHQYTTKTPYAEGVELSQGANSLYLPNRQREEKKKITMGHGGVEHASFGISNKNRRIPSGLGIPTSRIQQLLFLFFLSFLP